LPQEVRLPPGAQIDNASLGENSWNSQLSKLTEDNSRLTKALEDKDLKIKSIKEEFTLKLDAITST